MKRFFYQTYYFWLITRIIFIIGALMDSITIFSKGLEIFDMLINSCIITYLCLMVFNTIHECRNALVSSITKYIVGVLSLVLASVIIVLVVTKDSRLVALAGPFVIWIILLGIFDLTILNRSEETREVIELD